MINRVKIHIPIYTKEQIVVRDEITKILSKEYDAVVLSFEEVAKCVDGKPILYPFSIVSVYLKEYSTETLDYFKDLSIVISDKVKESIVLEVTIESVFIGTAIKED